MLEVQSAPPQSALAPYIRSYVQREARLGARELVEPVIARLGVMLEFEFAGAYEVRNYGPRRSMIPIPSRSSVRKAGARRD